MSYLLTNGIITDDVKTYIKDMLFLNFKLYPLDLPYNTELGIERRVDNNEINEFTDVVRLRIDTFLEKVNKRHGLNLSTFSMIVTNKKIDLTLNFTEDKKLDYELPLNQ